MSKQTINGVSLNYIETGSGSETVVFSHGYLMSLRMFDHQIHALSKNNKVIAYDHRCHGESQSVRTEFDLDALVEDAAELIKAKCDGPVHFAGMSTGGFVGMRLALKYPDLIKSLVLIDTSAQVEAPKSRQMNYLLLGILRWFGFRPVMKKAMAKLMGQTFLNDPARQNEVAYWKDYIQTLDVSGISEFGKAIFDRDCIVDALKSKKDLPPALIVVGAVDVATPVSNSEVLKDIFPGSELLVIPDSGHTSPVEEPEMVTEAIQAFVNKHGFV